MLRISLNIIKKNKKLPYELYYIKNHFSFLNLKKKEKKVNLYNRLIEINEKEQNNLNLNNEKNIQKREKLGPPRLAGTPKAPPTTTIAYDDIIGNSATETFRKQRENEKILKQQKILNQNSNSNNKKFNFLKIFQSNNNNINNNNNNINNELNDLTYDELNDMSFSEPAGGRKKKKRQPIITPITNEKNIHKINNKNLNNINENNPPRNLSVREMTLIRRNKHQDKFKDSNNNGTKRDSSSIAGGIDDYNNNSNNNSSYNSTENNKNSSNYLYKLFIFGLIPGIFYFYYKNNMNKTDNLKMLHLIEENNNEIKEVNHHIEEEQKLILEEMNKIEELIHHEDLHHINDKEENRMDKQPLWLQRPRN